MLRPLIARCGTHGTGWWEAVESPGSLPVNLSNANFRATTYVKHGEAALIAVADWSPAFGNYTSTLGFQFDWTALGLSTATAKLHVPTIPPFQLGFQETYDLDHQFNISADQGGLLLVVGPNSIQQ